MSTVFSSRRLWAACLSIIYLNVPSALRAEVVLFFDQALQQMQAHSPKLAAAQADVSAKILQRDAAALLGGPSVFFNANAIKYRLHHDFDLRDAEAQAQQHRTNLPQFPGSSQLIPKLLPADYELERRGHTHSENVTLVWPVFTGGRISGAKQVLAGRADESLADAASSRDELYDTLVNRYFGLQLAQQAVALRTQARKTIAVHDHAAERMLQQGLIARADRLEAAVLLEDAKRQEEKARNDERLAAIALQRLLRSDQPLRAASSMFMVSSPLPPLAEFQEKALQHHPVFSKLSAKKKQAQGLSLIEKGRFLPAVNIFGQSNIGNSKPSWAVGVGLSWTLWSGLDRREMVAAAEAQVQQAVLIEEGVRDDILLLVEKNWLAANDARRAYQALSANIALAQENVRLRRSGVREGLSTVPELMTAETKYVQARTEQMQAAYDYLKALSQLLAACGMPETFEDYLKRADIHVDGKDDVIATSEKTRGKE